MFTSLIEYRFHKYFANTVFLPFLLFSHIFVLNLIITMKVKHG
jgi:hypothetical protein